MMNKVEAEGEKAKTAYDEFMCYCNNGAGSLEATIQDAEKALPQVESALKETVSAHTQISEDLKTLKADTKEAQEAIGSAVSIRTQQASTFAKDSANLATNVDSVEKAVAALSKGMGSGFLQTEHRATAALEDLTVQMDLSNVDRQILTSFLSGKSDAPASGEILGILKQMLDEMKADLADMKGTEEQQLGSHNNMIAAKEREMAQLTKQVETKTGRLGEKAVAIANLKNEVEDTSEQLEVDKKFLANLAKNCETKKKDWAVYEKAAKGELLALSETIKILNDDDALDTFKKTLPSDGGAVFLQVSQTHRAKAAARILRKGSRHHGDKMSLIAMALSGRSDKGFGPVLKTITDMKAMMQEEQVDDDKKKSYCEGALDEADDSKKEYAQEVSDYTKEISDIKGRMETVAEEIVALDASVKDMDKQVEEQTGMRKSEAAEYTEDSAANNAAMKLLDMAKQRLKKFYQPSLVQVRKAAADGDEDADASEDAQGPTAPTVPTEDDEDVPADAEAESFLQTRAKDEQPEGPDLKSKKQNSGGVMEMLNTLMQDLRLQKQQADMEERQAQADYETFVTEAETKRAEDTKTLDDREGAKAELEASLQKVKSELKSSNANLAETKQELGNLHGECDFLLKYFDVRKEARTGEMEALGKAAAVLSGAKM